MAFHFAQWATIALMLSAASADLTKKAAAATGTPAWVLEPECAQAEAIVNSLAEFTKTACVVGQQQSGLDLNFFAMKPVFSDAEYRKRWLLSVVLGAGRVINEHPKAQVAFVVVTDMDLTRRNLSYWLTASKAGDLQRRWSAGKLNIRELWLEFCVVLKPSHPAPPME